MLAAWHRAGRSAFVVADAGTALTVDVVDASVDFLVPGILALYYSDAQYLLIVRIIRMLRIFRVLKLSPYLKQANYLLAALRGSKQKIIVFLVSVSTLVTVFGTLMYVIEGPEHGFTSIPKGIYWAIVTLTTVGYGDITPVTPIGKAASAAIAVESMPPERNEPTVTSARMCLATESSSAAAIWSMFACACPMETPGLRRAIVCR